MVQTSQALEQVTVPGYHNLGSFCGIGATKAHDRKRKLSKIKAQMPRQFGGQKR